jgi:hypothetical protein
MKLQRGRATLVQLEQFLVAKSTGLLDKNAQPFFMVVFMVIAPVW